MTIARKHLINYEQTCFYHCMSRCVRQGYLLNNNLTKKAQCSYRHDWIEERLLLLADVFAIDVYSFAIMDNHTHLVIHANLNLANQWSDTEVLRRWSRIGKLPILCQIYLSKQWRQHMNDVELSLIKEKITTIRTKLTDISYFMRYFNYYIAKRANKEDGVSGHFWEGRFKSQALLDADAFLACMAYVDLNPKRAALTTTLKKSKNTSIKRRMLASTNFSNTLIVPFRSEYSPTSISTLNGLHLDDYVAHLETVYRTKQNNSIQSFADNEDNWLHVSGSFEEAFEHCAGTQPYMQTFKEILGNKASAQSAEQRVLADAILSRLLDDQYPFGNEALAN